MTAYDPLPLYRVFESVSQEVKDFEQALETYGNLLQQFFNEPIEAEKLCSLLYLCMKASGSNFRGAEFGLALIRWVQRFWGTSDSELASSLAELPELSINVDEYEKLIFRLVAVRRLDLVCLLLQAHDLPSDLNVLGISSKTDEISGEHMEGKILLSLFLQAPSFKASAQSGGDAIGSWIMSCRRAINYYYSSSQVDFISNFSDHLSANSEGHTRIKKPLHLLLLGRVDEAFDAYTSQTNTNCAWALKFAAYIYYGCVFPGGFEFENTITQIKSFQSFSKLDKVLLSLLGGDWIAFAQNCLDSAPQYFGLENHTVSESSCRMAVHKVNQKFQPNINDDICPLIVSGAHLVDLVCRFLSPQEDRLHQLRDDLLLSYIRSLDLSKHWQVCCAYCLEIDSNDDILFWEFLKNAPHLDAFLYCEQYNLEKAAYFIVAERCAAFTNNPSWEPLVLAVRLSNYPLITEAALLIIGAILDDHRMTGPAPWMESTEDIENIWEPVLIKYPILEALLLACDIETNVDLKLCLTRLSGLRCRVPVQITRCLLDRCKTDEIVINDREIITKYLSGHFYMPLTDSDRQFLNFCLSKVFLSRGGVGC